MAQLVEDERALLDYEAALEHDPEDEAEMDWPELTRRQHNELTRGRLSGVRFTNGGSVGATRLG